MYVASFLGIIFEGVLRYDIVCNMLKINVLHKKQHT